MNTKLTEQIANHILANLGVLPADFVNQEQTRSIIDQQFMLPEKISFETEDGNIVHKRVYGCQMVITGDKEFRLFLADCTQEKEMPEYCLFTQLKSAPAFGVYCVFNQILPYPHISEALIAVSADKKHWMPCSTYLQATFLAGMEQIRDLGFGWTKCVGYNEQYAQLLSLIRFHDNLIGDNNDGV